MVGAPIGESSASVLEQHKENILPMPGGRSASKLTNTLIQSQTTKSVMIYKETLKREREHHEKMVGQLEELDDPLQVFIDYISWIHNNYQQGNNNESGLLNVLERCTSYFRDAYHYKNDPRYLKVWLEYTNYSDSPRDIFVYLAKKEIGNQLALYYEEFADYLEINGKTTDAEEIYQLGLNSQARPLPRLQRSYEHFKTRLESNTSTTNPNKRTGLELTQGSAIHDVQDGSRPNKKPRIEIFKDDSDNDQSVLKSIFDGQSASNDLGSIRSRIKENALQAKPWSGEVLRQKKNLERPNSSGSTSSSSSIKFQVYRDSHELNEDQKIKQTVCESNDGFVYTLINHPGKKSERVMINMDLLFLQEDEEITPEEMLAMTRRTLKQQQQQQQQQQYQQQRHTPIRTDESNNSNNTFVIPLKDENDTTLSNRPNSPTMTMFSKQANQEVVKIFNEAAADLNSDDEIERIDGVDSTTTNFDGFVTETIQMNGINNIIGPSLQVKETPPTDNELDDNVQSSPFIERPEVNDIPIQIIDNFDDSYRQTLLNSLINPIESYPGYTTIDIKIDKLKKFSELTTSDNKLIVKGNKNSIVDFCGEEIYCLRYELGKGGFGIVYLIEAGSSGQLKALKVESPCSKWEFYILNQIHRRTKIAYPESDNLFINQLELYAFQDESYLIMDYCNQGTLLDVVNHFKSHYGTTVDEVICIYLTKEILKSVEILHRIGILHGDLKADNCMLRFKPIEDGDTWNESYNKYGLHGWNQKSITLIDFGRSIDLKLFGDYTSPQFLSNWKTDQQDCPQMVNHEPWSYEADYYGIACIVHTMLFGSYIKIKPSHTNSTIQLENSLKRYWQHDLWKPLFDLLLNPYLPNDKKQPLVEEMAEIRQRFEGWLEENARKRNLKRSIQDLENDLTQVYRKRIG